MEAVAFFLDFSWKLLIVVSLGSTFIFASFLAVRFFFGKVSARFFNHLARYSSSVLLALCFVAGIVLSIADRDLQARCFGSFVEVQGGFGITRALGLLWLVGIAVLLFVDSVKIKMFDRKFKKCIIREESDFFLVCDTLPAMTFGSFKPKIAIPESMASNPTQLEYILAHEQTHVKNSDGLWSLVALLAIRICWFNPLSFLFEKNRVLAMELATDEQTIFENKLNSTKYAQALVAALGFERVRASGQMQISAASHFAQLKFRIEQMQPDSRIKHRVFYKWFVLGLMSLGWMFGISEALASIRVTKATVTNEVMCYQVQHEKIIENWFHIEKEANKCE